MSGAIIESDARPTDVQLKREAKLLTEIGLNTKHADCRIISEPIRKISPTYIFFFFFFFFF